MLTTLCPAPHGAHAEPGEALAHEARYAIYFAPREDSVWWKFGCAWLGRDPVADTPVPVFALAPFDAAYLARITTMPRRYGFHATLKAPFRLKSSYGARDVNQQASHLALSLEPAALPPLRLCAIDGFVALGFERRDLGTANVNAIAAQCVSCFDNLRARPEAQELARRHAAGITLRRANLLAEWGYPYVFDEYRFHLTLTNRLTAGEQQQVICALTPLVDTLASEPLLVDALAVYRQAAGDAPFVVTRRYGFDGTVKIYRDDV